MLTCSPEVAVWAWQTPEQDPLPALLDLLRGARASIFICAYGFTLGAVVDELIAARRRKVDVRLILDALQAKGKAEVEQLARLERARVPFVTGVSEKNRIIHLKQAIVDERFVWTGSWNWSKTASLEDNDCYLVALPGAARKRLAKFEREWKRLLARRRARRNA